MNEEKNNTRFKIYIVLKRTKTMPAISFDLFCGFYPGEMLNTDYFNLKRRSVSMKKAKFLVLVLVCVVMLMGAGYALWSETIELDATVNSTYLNIGVTAETETEYVYNIINPEAYGTKCTVKLTDNGRGAVTNSTKADVKFKNLFPGVTQTATIMFINDSKIPVQLEKVVYSNLKNIVGDTLTADIKIFTSSVEKDAGNFWDYKTILAGKTFIEGDPDGVVPSVILEPKSVFTYIIEVSLPEASGNESQLESFDFEIDHTWQQASDASGTEIRY
jgi:hypothetical protein